jgi:type VI secretion system secreted protein Hcp
MAESWQATTMFLYMEAANGVRLDGDSMDAVHNNEVQVMNVEVHVSAEKPTGGGGAGGAWRPDFSPVTMTIVVSMASPSLAAAAWSGTTFKRFILSCRKQGAASKSYDYLQWRFSTVQIIDHTFKVEDDKPTEIIKFTYQQIEFYYARQELDGTLKYSVDRTWSLDTNSTKDVTAMLPFTPKPSAAK